MCVYKPEQINIVCSGITDLIMVPPPPPTEIMNMAQKHYVYINSPLKRFSINAGKNFSPFMLAFKPLLAVYCSDI
jgi:hypothetical protein